MSNTKNTPVKASTHKLQFGQQETAFAKEDEVKSSNNADDKSKDVFSLFIKQHPALQNLINSSQSS
jgi:hypothetical protein